MRGALGQLPSELVDPLLEFADLGLASLLLGVEEPLKHAAQFGDAPVSLLG